MDKQMDTTTKEEKILDRIKKLLELGSSTNEHEAKLAIEKASSMMKEHYISEALLNKEKTKEITINYSDYYLPDRGAPWSRDLFSGIVKAFHCKVIYCTMFLKDDKRGRYYGRYFGTEGDRTTVKLIMQFATTSVFSIMEKEKELFKSMRKATQVPFRSYMNSFQKGISTGMRETLNAIARQNYLDKNPSSSTPSSYGLVLIKTEVKIERAFKELYPNTAKLSSTSTSSTSGYSAGKEEGLKVGFNRQVSNSNKGYLR